MRRRNLTAFFMATSKNSGVHSPRTGRPNTVMRYRSFLTRPWTRISCCGSESRFAGLKFTSSAPNLHWLVFAGKLYPNRVELHTESGKPELIFMDQIEEIGAEYVNVKVSGDTSSDGDSSDVGIVTSPRTTAPDALRLVYNPISVFQGEHSIVLKMKSKDEKDRDARIIFTNQDEIALKVGVDDLLRKWSDAG